MPSQADTLKVAQLDVVTIGQKIGDARQGRMFGSPSPLALVKQSIRLLEQTARRLRKSFRIDEGD